MEGRTGDIFSISGSDRIFARKAQMSYGWDFCARCVTAGIWKGVRLERVPETEMPEVYAFTERLEGDDAIVCVQVDLPEGTHLRARLGKLGRQALITEIGNCPGLDRRDQVGRPERRSLAYKDVSRCRDARVAIRTRNHRCHHNIVKMYRIREQVIGAQQLNKRPKRCVGRARTRHV